MFIYKHWGSNSSQRCIIICNLTILKFEMYVYRRCPKRVVETLIVEHIGVHHKSVEAMCQQAVQLLLFTLSLLFMFLHLNYFATTITYVKNTFSSTLLSTSKIQNVRIWDMRYICFLIDIHNQKTMHAFLSYHNVNQYLSGMDVILMCFVTTFGVIRMVFEHRNFLHSSHLIVKKS